MFKYGYIPSFKHRHTRRFSLAHGPLNIPPRVDWRAHVPPYPQQGRLSSCVANAVHFVMKDSWAQSGIATADPSRLMIYFGARRAQGWQDHDGGCMITDAIDFATQTGVCEEAEWPYNESAVNTPPPAQCYSDVDENIIVREQLDNEDGSMFDKLCVAIAARLLPPIGFTVYESFETDKVARTGIVPNPQPGEAVLGGHGVCGVGYDRELDDGYIICPNWWGDWGDTSAGHDKGSFWLPREFFDRGDVSDCWVIRSVGSVQKSNNPPLPQAA